MQIKTLFCTLAFVFMFNCFLSSFSATKYPEKDEILPIPDKVSDSVISGSVSQNLELNLENCIKIALGNNPQISSSFQDILVADSRIKQIWSNFFPVFSWQTSYTHIKQLQLSDAFGRNLQFDYYLLGQISLQQMLYDFGVTQNQATIRKLDYKGYQKKFEETVNDVIFQTKDAFYNLLYAYEKEKVAIDSVEKYELFYKQAKSFYVAGYGPKVDVTIAQSNLSGAKLELIQAQNNINLAIARLNNIMGTPYLKKYSVVGELKFEPTNITFERSVEIARESRPELKLADIKVENARQNIKLTQKSILPTISIEGQYQRGGKHWTSNDGFNIGGFLVFPGINLALYRNQIKEARYLYDKELANAKTTQNSIYLELQNAYIKLNEKRNQLPVSMLQVQQTKENYEISSKRYQLGAGSPIELKNAESIYVEARLEYFNTLYEYNVAKAQLERAMGRNISCDDIIDLNNVKKY